MLKTILITEYQQEVFKYELDKIINTINNASIQFRTPTNDSGTILYAALIVHEVPDEVEGDKDDGGN